ncbi:MAG: hypothetical protein O8C66_01155 [Candidatus Methanoperedens sp.]|nr:hypothetical protein [Candidatus Methanoperedens sp.]MCZ7369095.1 hypothetical protein [Candidatus Methanoperedens sp.]
MSNEQRVTFTPLPLDRGFSATRVMKELLYKWEEVSKANNSNLTPAVMLDEIILRASETNKPVKFSK